MNVVHPHRNPHFDPFLPAVVVPEAVRVFHILKQGFDVAAESGEVLRGAAAGFEFAALIACLAVIAFFQSFPERLEGAAVEECPHRVRIEQNAGDAGNRIIIDVPFQAGLVHRLHDRGVPRRSRTVREETPRIVVDIKAHLVSLRYATTI